MGKPDSRCHGLAHRDVDGSALDPARCRYGLAR